ncbi:hypothetical protein ACFY5D_16750 [Paeniglutamicibacter sp. NPDC012692]|uniref:hypothetical protein n=1 Tax=Paeniglutamicibacter sp. NPDC012692 TaxID=3364388 RepID=UPI003698AA4E
MTNSNEVTTYPWGKIPGFNSLDYSAEENIAYYRIDLGRQPQGWSELDDLIREAAGPDSRCVGMSNARWKYLPVEAWERVYEALVAAGVAHRVEISIPE